MIHFNLLSGKTNVVKAKASKIKQTIKKAKYIGCESALPKTLAMLAIFSAGGLLISSKIKNTQPSEKTIEIDKQIKKSQHPILCSIESLGNDRIRAIYQIGNERKAIELPEFLYHFTNEDAHEKIQASGVLKKTDYEDSPGVYLVDKKNLFEHYESVQAGSETHDLLTALLVKTGTASSDSESLGYIYQIPTRDLLINGNIKIRTQEDYFSCKEVVKEVDKKLEALSVYNAGLYSFADIVEEDIKASFIEDVLSNGIMTQDELEQFIKDRHKKLAVGYDIFEAFSEKLEDTKAIEYVYDKDINLADFPNIKAKGIRFFDYFSLENTTADCDKFKALFEENFG